MLSLLVNTRRWSFGLALLATVIVFLPPAQAFADTCSPVPQDESSMTCMGQLFECPAQSGGIQNISNTGSSQSWPQSAVANTSSFNPSPVYVTSSVWSALEQNNQNKGLIAQIGWIHDQTSNNEYVFAQWTDNNGNFSPIHSFYTTPSGANNYAVYRESNGVYELEWSGGWTFAPSTVTWGPDTVTEAGEVDGFDPNSGQGDHFPGNRTTPVTFSNVNWLDQYGTDHTASLTYFGGNHQNTANGAVPIPPYGYVYNWSGSQFEVWDNRCS